MDTRSSALARSVAVAATTPLEGTARNGDVEIVYDIRGNTTDPLILLIMGLGAQMIAWQEEFCDMLVGHGFRVARFDNRDVGLSTKSTGPVPQIGDLARLISPFGRRPEVGYTLSDMAADAMAVLDEIGVQSAHIVGASLGGMIAQTVAIEHPNRVRSLTSIMSRTGAITSGLPTPKTLKMLVSERPTDREHAVQAEVDRYSLIAGPLFERERMAAFSTRAIERSFNPDGPRYQLAAMFASGDRTKKLRSVTAPTLVIHGRADRLVRLSGGVATAKAVANADLIVHNQMGHDLPLPLWSRITDSIAGLAGRAEMVRSQAVGS